MPLNDIICIEIAKHFELSPHHFKPSQRKVSQSSRIKQLIRSPEVLDVDGVVEDDALGVLDVAQRGNIKLHPAHIIRVTPNLEK